MRNLERLLRVLLHEHNRDALFVELFDDVEDIAHDQRCKTQRRLVQQQNLRVCHQRAPDGEHLLFAAGERAGNLLCALAENRETLIHHRKVCLALRLGDGEATRDEVIFHRQIGKDLTSFWGLYDSARDELFRGQRMDLLAVGENLAAGDGDKTGDCAQ